MIGENWAMDGGKLERGKKGGIQKKPKKTKIKQTHPPKLTIIYLSCRIVILENYIMSIQDVTNPVSTSFSGFVLNKDRFTLQPSVFLPGECSAQPWLNKQNPFIWSGFFLLSIMLLFVADALFSCVGSARLKLESLSFHSGSHTFSHFIHSSCSKSTEVIKLFFHTWLTDKQELQCRQLMAGLDKVVNDLDKQEKAIYSQVRPPLEQNRPVQDTTDRMQLMRVKKCHFSSLSIFHKCKTSCFAVDVLLTVHM